MSFFAPRRLMLVTLALALVLPAACTGGSGGGGSGTKSDHPTPGSSTSTLTATRWWSNSAAAEGSTIDPKDPAADASKLGASQDEYCGMLKQTLAAGKSILPGASASDPALLTSTKAFIAEIQQVAPASVSAQWQVVGDAIVEFVKSGGKSLGANAAAGKALATAVQQIGADAKAKCHVDLAQTTAAPTK